MIGTAPRGFPWRLPGVLALLALAACGGGDPVPSRLPSLLIVVMDTTRGDRVSYATYDRPTTPGLEAFARTAVSYADAWSPSSWSAPAHASLFTGLRPEHHGLMEGVRPHLEESSETLAELLLARGYRTGCFSANPFVSPKFGLTQGFEDVLTRTELEEGGYPQAPLTHGRAQEWLKKARKTGKPWFLFINDMEPHMPYTPPRDEQDRFQSHPRAASEIEFVRALRPAVDATSIMLGLTPMGGERWSIVSDLYDAEVATLDREVGKLLDDLERDGALGNTIVLILSDHGENLGDHGLSDHLFSLHRSLLHVPVLLRAPGRLEGGRVVEETVRLEDLFPTLLDLLGVPVPPDLDSESLLGGISGRIARAQLGENRIPKIRDVFPEFDSSRLGLSIRSVYDGRHHLLEWEDESRQLFDVKDDPRELNDLSRERADVVERLLDLLPRRP